MSIVSNSPSMPQQKGSSATQNTSVGSGSRPTKSRYPIKTSAPANARTLGGRGDVPGALGMGGPRAKPQ